MLPPLAVLRSLPGCASRPWRDDPPAAAPPSPPPSDIDFSTIDTPQKAAILPSLNGSMMYVLVNSLNMAIESGEALSATVRMELGAATPAAITYLMPDPTRGVVKVQGTLGTAQVQETWTLNPADETLSVNGSIGGSTEQLTMSGGWDGLHVDGTIGKVEVHQFIAQHGGLHPRLVWDGTIGDQKNHQELTIAANDDQDPMVHVEGTLGEVPVLVDAVTADDNVWNLTGHGEIAGIPIDYSQDVELTEPGATERLR